MNNGIPSRKELFTSYPFLADLVLLAQKDLKLNKIYLFGSRARGDAREKSDFDLAFEANTTSIDWLNFCNKWDNEKESLHSFDLIWLNSVDKAFRDKILSEGVLLHG